MSLRLSLELLLLIAATLVGGCASVEGNREDAWVARRAKAVARTEIVLQNGVFYKPREGSADEDTFRLAPLIVQEVGAGRQAWPGPSRIAAVRLNESGTREFDPSEPTVYWEAATVVLKGRDYRQRTYVWCYPPEPDGTRAKAVSWHGVRMTLDDDGFPVIWEWLGDPAGLIVMFVSASLEDAAVHEFGDPLPQRNFAVERGADVRPDVVVARVLDEGPVPMGPFVYQTAERRTLTTLTCRCMPSQVRNLVDDAYYDLKPLRRWAEPSRNQAGPPPMDAAGTAWIEVGLQRAERLERVLRLPDHL